LAVRKHSGCAQMAGRDGQLSLIDFCLGVVRAPPDVDRAEVEAQVKARRQARLQRAEDAKSAAAAAKRPVSRPPKPRPDVPGPAPQPAAAAEPAAPPRQYRKWTADEGAFALEVCARCAAAATSARRCHMPHSGGP
jgi:hypothetical protein